MNKQDPLIQWDRDYEAPNFYFKRSIFLWDVKNMDPVSKMRLIETFTIVEEAIDKMMGNENLRPWGGP